MTTELHTSFAPEVLAFLAAEKREDDLAQAMIHDEKAAAAFSVALRAMATAIDEAEAAFEKFNGTDAYISGEINAADTLSGYGVTHDDRDAYRLIFARIAASSAQMMLDDA